MDAGGRGERRLRKVEELDLGGKERRMGRNG